MTDRMQIEQIPGVRQRRDRLVSDISARLVLRGIQGERETADQLLASVFAEVARHLNAEYYFNFVVVDGAPRTLRLVTCAGVNEKARAALEAIGFGDYLCGMVAERQEPLVLEDLSRTGLPQADAMCALGATAYAGFPMLAGDRLIGTISFATSSRSRFSAEDVELIQTVADLLAAAVERERLSATLQESETRLRQTLDALSASERRFREFADAAPAMLWITDPTGYCTYLSSGWYSYTGQREEEGHGLGWTMAVHPEDREAAGVAFIAANAAREEYVRDFRLRRADGVYRWVIDVGRPHFDTAGEFRGFVGSVIDNDDRKRAQRQLQASEQRFKSAIAATSDLLWTNDPTGQMSGEQPGWGNFTGQTQEEYAGYGWTQSLHPDDIQPSIAAWEQAVASRQMFIWEHRVRRADGVYRRFAIRAVPLINSDGSVREWVGVHTDITDQRAAEDALKEADRRKDEFLATLAHELRNPLAPIRTGLQVMKVAPHSEHAAAARDMMERQIGHMVRLIDDLLDVSRISSGKIELRVQRLDLRLIVDAALEASLPLVDSARHNLVVELPDTPVWIEADLTRLSQAISNLINNAAKYTPDGGRITLSARQEGNQAVLELVDTGVGIPAEMMSQVFDIFTQVNPTHDRTQGGLGIGLTLVRQLVELHGGTVEARSKGLARGSTFTVRLPASDAPHPDSTVASTDTPRPANSGLRVLVVDDHVDGAAILDMLLGLMGHHTRTAHDGPAALIAARNYMPDAVLLDIGLPGLNGYEVAQQLRADPAFDHVTLVALTGWGSDDDREQSREAGFDFHLTKPIDSADLERVLVPRQLAEQTTQ